MQTARRASSSGTAMKAPATPQSQPQIMTERNTNTGLRRRRWPMIIGLMKLASMPCSSRNAAGGPSIATPVPKVTLPASSSSTAISSGPR